MRPAEDEKLGTTPELAGSCGGDLNSASPAVGTAFDRVCERYRSFISRNRKTGRHISPLRKFKSQLNGANGEYTGADDVNNKKLRKQLRNLAIRGVRTGAGMATRTAAQAATAAAGAYGGPAGAAAGNFASQLVKKKVDAAVGRALKGKGLYTTSYIKGSGSYTSSNIDGGTEGATVSPVILGGGDEEGSTVFTKRDYLCDVYVGADSSFYNSVFNINVGLASTFPWLSQLASNFTVYEMLQLVFEYVPVVSNSSTSGQMGTLMLACNYNAGEDGFASKTEMMEYSGSISRRPCDSVLCGIECDSRKFGGQRVHFVRGGAVPSGQDIKTYDIGTFQVATSGINTTVFAPGSQLGSIYVNYKVKMMKPRMYDSLGKSIPEDFFVNRAGYNPGTYALSGTVRACPQNTLGCTMANNVLTIPDQYNGPLEIEYTCFATSFSGNVSLTTAGNITTIVAGQASPDGITAGNWVFSALLRDFSGNYLTFYGRYNIGRPAIAKGNTFTFVMPTVTTGVSAWLRVRPFNPELTGPSTGWGA